MPFCTHEGKGVLNTTTGKRGGGHGREQITEKGGGSLEPGKPQRSGGGESRVDLGEVDVERTLAGLNLVERWHLVESEKLADLRVEG